MKPDQPIYPEGKAWVNVDNRYHFMVGEIHADIVIQAGHATVLFRRPGTEWSLGFQQGHFDFPSVVATMAGLQEAGKARG